MSSSSLPCDSADQSEPLLQLPNFTLHFSRISALIFKNQPKVYMFYLRTKTVPHSVSQGREERGKIFMIGVFEKSVDVLLFS